MIILAAALTLSGCSQQQALSRDNSDAQKKPAQAAVAAKTGNSNEDLPTSSVETIADKVQVFLFHTTQRCSTCIAIGKLSGETVKERFQEELKSGRIEFREVNIDLPENKDLARKFRAAGSALYLNAIINGKDNIKQDTKVWRLTNTPATFKDYLEGRINILLGK